MMKEKANAHLFKADIQKRGITRLIHFTPTINLLGILQEGYIFSRKQLGELNIDSTDIMDFLVFNDQYRFDDITYINTSIERPNSFLLQLFIERTKDLPHISWCILSINPKFIYALDTLFSITNASNSYNRNFIGISGDYKKFSLMFANNIQVVSSKTTRQYNRMYLQDSYTTDEQAEVLIQDMIPSSDILSISFPSEKKMKEAKASLSDYNCSKFKVDQSLFEGCSFAE